jgi:5-formyltetrahydrofolate cyclo-ligase
MTKKELRKILLEQRMKLSTRQRQTGQDMILIQFQHLPLPYLQYLHAYQSMDERNEPDTEPLVSFLKFRNPGLKRAVPRIMGDKDLAHVLVDDHTEWEVNAYGIQEPAEGEDIAATMFDLVLVPMAGCDLYGNRIGYGKGYYDRFLALCRPDCIKVGISFLSPLEYPVPVDPWDVKLDYCITPQQIYAFE